MFQRHRPCSRACHLFVRAHDDRELIKLEGTPEHPPPPETDPVHRPQPARRPVWHPSIGATTLFFDSSRTSSSGFVGHWRTRLLHPRDNDLGLINIASKRLAEDDNQALPRGDDKIAAAVPIERVRISARLGPNHCQRTRTGIARVCHIDRGFDHERLRLVAPRFSSGSFSPARAPAQPEQHR